METPGSDRSDHTAPVAANDASGPALAALAVGADGYRTATLADGRRLEYLVEGDPDGFPLVFHHGTPGAAVSYPGVSATARERGLALVFVSRPGYGGSTPRPDRTIADVASDVAAVLDDLGRGEFITLGWSGGGPHSLACAAMLPERCRGAATGAGVAPFHADGLKFFEGMAAENVTEYHAALAGRNQLEPLLEEEAARLGAVSAEQLADMLGGLLSPADKAYATGEFASRLLASITRGVTHGVEGWVEDDLAFMQHWNFELGRIMAPVSIWQGGADRTVPLGHGMWLAAHVPGAQARVCDVEGHLSLFGKLDMIFDNLIDQAGL